MKEISKYDSDKQLLGLLKETAEKTINFKIDNDNIVEISKDDICDSKKELEKPCEDELRPIGERKLNSITDLIVYRGSNGLDEFLKSVDSMLEDSNTNDIEELLKNEESEEIKDVFVNLENIKKISPKEDFEIYKKDVLIGLYEKLNGNERQIKERPAMFITKIKDKTNYNLRWAAKQEIIYSDIIEQSIEIAKLNEQIDEIENSITLIYATQNDSDVYVEFIADDGTKELKKLPGLKASVIKKYNQNIINELKNKKLEIVKILYNYIENIKKYDVK